MKYFLFVFLFCIFPIICLGQNSDSTEFDRLVEGIFKGPKIVTVPKPMKLTTEVTATPFETTKMSTEHSTSHSSSSPSPTTTIATSTLATSAISPSSSSSTRSSPSVSTSTISSSPSSSSSPFPSSSPSPCPCPPAEEKTSHGWMIVGIIFIILAILEAIPLAWFGLRSFRSQIYGRDNDGLLNS